MAILLVPVLLAQLAFPAQCRTAGDAGVLVMMVRVADKIPVQLLSAPGHIHRPLIVILHGRGGIAIYETRMQELGRRLVAHGFNVAIVHYFGLIEPQVAPEVTEDNFSNWCHSVTEALTALSELQSVDARRIGIVGFSLSASLDKS